MGSGEYNFSSRSLRSASYKKMSVDDLFEQNVKRTAHESMIPSRSENKANLRESRDSDGHPNSVPIIIALDVTGSMEHIPEHLIKEGLPKIIEALMERGVADPQVLIMAVGDSKCDGDNGVFQLGQFESADDSMDMWLQRIWIRKGGGGNGGESYNWAHYYALNHTATDAWDKRKQKGFLFTIGDDNCHQSLVKTEMDEVMGYLSKGETVDTTKLMDELTKKWNVYHIDLSEGNNTKSWDNLLGVEKNLKVGRRNYQGMADAIVNVVTNNVKLGAIPPKPVAKKDEDVQPTNPIL